MSQDQMIPDTKAKSSKDTTNEVEKSKTPTTTPFSTESVARTPDQLMMLTQLAQNSDVKIVFASKEVMEIFTKGASDEKPYFTMRGCMVVEEGKLLEAEQDFNLTANQYNNL